MSDANILSVPKWYWAVAGLALLWNLFGGFDYFNSVTLNEAYLGEFGPEMIDFIKGMPIWAKGVWGIAIVSSILASLCLLLRKSLAFTLYCVAFVFMILSFIYQWTAATRPQVEGGTIMTVVVFAVAIFLIWFSRMAKGKGWLN